jgi:hypothetical protein
MYIKQIVPETMSEEHQTTEEMQKEIDDLKSKMKMLLENKTQEHKQPQRQQHRQPQVYASQKHCHYNEKCSKFNCLFKHGPQRKKLCRYCMNGSCNNKSNKSYIHSFIN